MPRDAGLPHSGTARDGGPPQSLAPTGAGVAASGHPGMDIRDKSTG